MANENNQATYADKYVAFLDILGFGEIVKGSERSPDHVGGLLQALKETRENAETWLVGPASEWIKWHTFSDSIVVSAEATPNGLEELLSTVSFLSFSLLMRGLLVRGGVSRGLLHHDANVMFGPGFLHAYDLERRIAKYPRIIVDKRVCSDYNSYALRDRQDCTPIEFDDDGPAYIDLLDLSANDDFAASRLAEIIQNQINDARHEPDHYVKLRWLAQKWNAKVDTVFGGKREYHVKYRGWDTVTWKR
jgi:hypothetical protein